MFVPPLLAQEARVPLVAVLETDPPEESIVPALRESLHDLHYVDGRNIRFEVRESYASGSECANVGTITIGMANGMRARVDGVFVYRVNEAGKLVSMRAYWEFDRMLASMSAP